MSYALRLGAFVVGAGLTLAAACLLLNPPLSLSIVILLSCGVAVWWGVHVLVTRRPW